MKQFQFVVLSGVLGALVLGAGTSNPVSESKGKHDFALPEQSEIHSCAACHTPHQKSGQVPHWELRKSAPAAVMPYLSDRDRPDSTTLMCLSCHDGTVATDISAGQHRVFPQNRIGASGGKSRQGTGHPLGVRYPVFDAKYQSRGKVEADGKIKLPDGRVACISCHDPHDREGLDGMLVKSNRRSSLCLSCHRL
jgi:predicted CXXCH cytochrome family protein